LSRRIAIVAALLTIPGTGVAAELALHLLDTGSLFFSLQDEGPPRPPGPPGAAAPPQQPEGEEIPSRGSVLGYLIAGGVVLANGIGFTIEGAFYLFLPTVFSAGLGTSCTSSFSIIGLVLALAGLVLDAIGGTLLYLGIEKRRTRSQLLAARAVTVDYSPVVKSPLLRYAVHF
jgi:hypothetical protein